MTEYESTPADRPHPHAHRFRPSTFEDRFGLLSFLDPHFAGTWADYLDGLYARPGLDVRTRLLVLAGQYTVMGNQRGLRDVVTAAIAEDVRLKDVLESIFLTMVYGGESSMLDAVETFATVVGEHGLLDDVAAQGLPPETGTASTRSLDDERRQWSEEDVADPRTAPLLERYGWEALSTGLRLRPRAQLDTVTRLDVVDQGFAALWLTAIYGRIYTRGVLDDRTRLLCMIGDCMAMGESKQLARHLRNALRHGASTEEVLEVIFQSCIVVGHPSALGLAFDRFITILDEERRLTDVMSEEQIAELREVMARR